MDEWHLQTTSVHWSDANEGKMAKLPRDDEDEQSEDRRGNTTVH